MTKASRLAMSCAAFGVHVAGIPQASGASLTRGRCRPRRARAFPVACEERAPAAVPATPAPPQEDPSLAALPSFSLPPGTASGAQALLDDMAERPQYYLNVTGVVVGLGLSAVVLSATMGALDAIPLVPDGLRIVGLGYVFWFLNKFLLNGGERKRLAEEIDEFVDGVKGDVVERGIEAGGEDDPRLMVEGLEKADADLVM